MHGDDPLNHEIIVVSKFPEGHLGDGGPQIVVVDTPWYPAEEPRGR